MKRLMVALACLIVVSGLAFADELSEFSTNSSRLNSQLAMLANNLRDAVVRMVTGGYTPTECGWTFNDFGKRANDLKKEWDSLHVPAGYGEYHTVVSNAYGHYIKSILGMALVCLTQDKQMMDESIREGKMANELVDQAIQMLHQKGWK